MLLSVKEIPGIPEPPIIVPGEAIVLDLWRIVFGDPFRLLTLPILIGAFSEKPLSVNY